MTTVHIFCSGDQLVLGKDPWQWHFYVKFMVIRVGMYVIFIRFLNIINFRNLFLGHYLVWLSQIFIFVFFLFSFADIS